MVVRFRFCDTVVDIFLAFALIYLLHFLVKVIEMSLRSGVRLPEVALVLLDLILPVMDKLSEDLRCPCIDLLFLMAFDCCSGSLLLLH